MTKSSSVMTQETELIRALAEDLAIEMLAAYPGEDVEGADFTSLGKAIAYLQECGSGPGPALQELIAKVHRAEEGSPREVPSEQDDPFIIWDQ